MSIGAIHKSYETLKSVDVIRPPALGPLRGSPLVGLISYLVQFLTRKFYIRGPTLDFLKLFKNYFCSVDFVGIGTF